MTHLLLSLLDFLLPRHCSVCGKRLSVGEKGVCMQCLLELQLTEYHDAKPGNKLERVFWLKLPIHRAGAFMVYDHDSTQRNIVLDLKYHNHPMIGYHLGKMMCRELQNTNFFDHIDVIIPMPIAPDHRRKRGYNQAEMLAKGINEMTGIPINTRTLKRKNYATTQTRLTALERIKNVKDSFYLGNNRSLANKHILIVEDVITTGATILACCRTLMQMPGVSFSILSLSVSNNLLKNIKHANGSLLEYANSLLPYYAYQGDDYNTPPEYSET